MKSNVTAGVYATFERMGIKEPESALEMLAVTLAERIDSGVDDKSLAGISGRLCLILEQLELNHPPDTNDKVDALAKDANKSA